MTPVQASLVQALRERGARSPEAAVDGEDLRRSLSCTSVQFDAAIAELAGIGLVACLQDGHFLAEDDPSLLTEKPKSS